MNLGPDVKKSYNFAACPKYLISYTSFEVRKSIYFNHAPSLMIQFPLRSWCVTARDTLYMTGFTTPLMRNVSLEIS